MTTARVCTKAVSDYTGFHFSACNRPAKFVVTFDDGREPKHRCGIHARNLPPFATRTAIPKATL